LFVRSQAANPIGIGIKIDFEKKMKEEFDHELVFKKLGLRRYHRIQINAGKTKWIGYVLLISSIGFGLLLFYAIILSKLLPETGIYALDAIKHDEYFCFLIPLAVVPTYIVIYLNWVAMTHFIQN
jgi:hypothetical protein